MSPPSGGRRGGHTRLSEDLASAQDGVAAEAAGDHQELYDPPGQWQIGQRVADSGYGYAAKPSRTMDTGRHFRTTAP